jgi:ATP-dependent protease ClpP protease subunit
MTRRALPRLDIPADVPRGTSANAEAKPWFQVIQPSASAPSTATIRVYGPIGDSYWDDTTGPRSLAAQLDELGSISQIDLHVNSPGGDAFAGVAIYNMLSDHDANVTVYVDGLAASAASVIAMSGDEIVMGIGSEMMIHDASTFAWGPADEMVKAAKMLDTLSDGMAELYASRAGGTAEEWRAVMKEETWYSAKEAVSAGLAERISRQKDEEAAEARGRFDVRMFHYKGRNEAPAPKTPAASASGDKNERNPVNEAQLAALRKALGAPENATPDDLISLASETTMALAQAPLEAELPAGAVAVDGSVLESLKADAAAGRLAREEQLTERRERLVTEAFLAGKITADGREGWRTKLAVEGAQAEADLARLAPGLIPVAEIGHDSGEIADDEAVNSPDSVRSSAKYQSWKV